MTVYVRCIMDCAEHLLWIAYITFTFTLTPSTHNRLHRFRIALCTNSSPRLLFSHLLMSDFPRRSISRRLASSAGMKVFILASGFDGTKSALQDAMSSRSSPIFSEVEHSAGRLFVTPPSMQIIPRCTQTPGCVQVGMYCAAITALIKSSRDLNEVCKWLCGTGNMLDIDIQSLPCTIKCAFSGKVVCSRYRQNCPTQVRCPNKSCLYASAIAGMCAQISAGWTPQAVIVKEKCQSFRNVLNLYEQTVYL